jgi:uncharacterized MAPEG superfamily protein
MSAELYWLTLTVVMTCLLWVPYILDRFATRGIMGTFANPSPDLPAQSAWAERLKAAHYNTVENLAVFAPLVLTLHVLGISTATTVLACAVFFWARLAYVVIYTMGIIVLRTLAFTIAFFAQAALALAIFGLI